MSSTAPTPSPSQQQLVNAAKAPILGYNDKNWDAVKSSLQRDALYDEVATQRKFDGADQVVACWRGWATAMPDSKATFHNIIPADNIVTIELTWRGTHTGPLELAGGQVAPTNRSIEIRACQICEMVDGKVQTMRHYFDMATLLDQLGVRQ